MPGDTVAYRNKQLTINGQPVPMNRDSDFQYAESGLNYGLDQALSGKRSASMTTPS